MFKIMSGPGGRKLQIFFRKVFEAFRLKVFAYRLVITPSQNLAIKRLRKIMDNSHIKIKKDPKGKKIIFNCVDARYTGMTNFEGILAKALQIRGHDVKMLICNGLFDLCPGHFTVKKPKNKWRCKNCKNFSNKFLQTIELPYGTYFEYLNNVNLEEISKKVDNLSVKECENYVYKNVKVGFHSITSVNRYFMGEKPNKKDYERILKIQLKYAIISTDVAENVIKKEKPDVLVTSHACFSTWGSFAEVFINKRIPTRVWATGERNTTVFEQHKSNDYYKGYLEEIRKRKPLNEKEEKELQSFLEKRTQGKEGQVSMYNFSDVAKEKIVKKFNFDKFDKTYVIYPNVPWDIGLLKADAVFDSIYSWVKYTIELFLDKPNLLLIVKVHPSELRVMESKYTVKDYIDDKFKNLPDNVKIIPPDTSISPYALFPFIDVGIVYNGTVGLEMAIKGIPVIAAGNAHYGKKGISYDIKSKKDYEKILFSDLKPKENQENFAKIYAYFHFIKKFQPRPYMTNKSFLEIRWNVNSLEDLMPGKDKIIDHLSNYVVKGGIFQAW